MCIKLIELLKIIDIKQPLKIHIIVNCLGNNSVNTVLFIQSISRAITRSLEKIVSNRVSKVFKSIYIYFVFAMKLSE